MDYMKMEFNDILEWCKKNNQLEWLLAKTEETKEYPVYPKVEKVKADGTVVMVYDKNQAPIGTKTDKLPFTQVKKDFCAKFMPEVIPEAKSKKPSMADLVKAAMGK